jgi:hypothetical protein
MDDVVIRAQALRGEAAADVPPAIDLTEHRAGLNIGRVQPIALRLNRTQARGRAERDERADKSPGFNSQSGRRKTNMLDIKGQERGWPQTADGP